MLDTHALTRRRHLPALVLLLSLAIWGALAAPRPAMAQAGSPRGHEYVGTWNYDQPDRASMRNVAVIRCPELSSTCSPSPELQIPQIGTIVFSKEAGGRIVGRTDQGCTWTFAVGATSLELDSPAQYCFNRVINSAYTITKWSVAVSGNHERESVVAISHQPTGDYEFRLDLGSRTKVTGGAWAGAREVFPGTWRYDASDPQSRVNVLTTRYTDPDGQVRTVQTPQQGLVTFAPGRGKTMTARTENGCAWTLTARGNTAELDPPVQTCRTAQGTATLTFWAIASDGRRQSTVMAGTDERGGNFLLSVGSLTKR
ncbi:hypothetical protein [Nonomuraea jiangxiensis]|uniref:Uncharacterized protein n=1 Tax=Nonomuraea jiangxiensis TaxID=633440 RepID=A0A1G9QJC7_9ACTN|nr:hypothetical protein [Nonomuraea jiangxiensis]SDM11128.1 hypothetical protein SAMN05421869_13654 [Nonomuraea jiangxiensis]